jgi:hypothetical protein
MSQQCVPENSRTLACPGVSCNRWTTVPQRLLRHDLTFGLTPLATNMIWHRQARNVHFQQARRNCSAIMPLHIASSGYLHNAHQQPVALFLTQRSRSLQPPESLQWSLPGLCYSSIAHFQSRLQPRSATLRTACGIVDRPEVTIRDSANARR